VAVEPHDFSRGRSQTNMGHGVNQDELDHVRGMVDALGEA
jgi:hypothetical protein